MMIRLCSALFVLCVASISAWAADDSKPTPVALISPQKLVERIQAGEKIMFVDVRQPEEYAPEHIPGAVNIPSGELVARSGELPRDAVLIPYCNMDFRGFVAARDLVQAGLKVALMQERGLYGWAGQGLPVAGTKSGQSDQQALAKLQKASVEKLLGDRFVTRIPPSGRSRQIPVRMEEWYFEPNDFQVDAGDEVRLAVTSGSGEHYFILPDYEVQVKVPEGETREIVFVADRTGDFKFGTCEWDGSGLQVMKGRLQVTPPKETTP